MRGRWGSARHGCSAGAQAAQQPAAHLVVFAQQRLDKRAALALLDGDTRHTVDDLLAVLEASLLHAGVLVQRL